MSELSPTNRLLQEVFPGDSKYRDESYLEWLYRRSPSGEVIEANRDDSTGRIGHYAIVPQRWALNGVVGRAALSLNTAVSERARGMGLFTLLAAEAYELAEVFCVEWVVGVANANSTPGFTRKLGFELKESLDARVVLGFSWKRPNCVNIDDLDSFRSLVLRDTETLLQGDFRRHWDVDELRWRLSNPAAKYTLVFVDGCLVVGIRSVQFGMPVGIVLKVFVGEGAPSVSLSRVARAMSRAVRAPFSVYGGRNNQVRPGGIRIPRRLRPSPLNLIVKALGGGGDQIPTPSVIEFLDFDAY